MGPNCKAPHVEGKKKEQREYKVCKAVGTNMVSNHW